MTTTTEQSYLVIPPAELILEDLPHLLGARMALPGRGWRFGRRFGLDGKPEFHNGVDLPAPEGTVIFAPWDGAVVRVWDDVVNGGGLSLKLWHEILGLWTGYGHLQQALVKPGEMVTAGTAIAKVGKSGRLCRGAHVHFTVRGAGAIPRDPLPYLLESVQRREG